MEGCSFTDLAFYGYHPVHSLYHVLHNRQSQSGASHLARTGFVYAVESFEDPGEILRGDADAAVGDDHGYAAIVVLSNSYPDFPVRTVEFYGIGQQI